MKKKQNNYWQDLVNKHLVGKYIVRVQWLSPSESHKLMGWDSQPCELHLNDGTIITPSADDEGNEAGAFFTNIQELPCCPVFRESIE